MAAREAARVASKQVRPLLSVDRAEARQRVLNLYKAWHRYIPYMGNRTFYTCTSSNKLYCTKMLHQLSC